MAAHRRAPRAVRAAGEPRPARNAPVARGGVRLKPVVELARRIWLLTAAVGALEEFGYEQTTVAQITTRARVSRRTFYELFANREECIAAVLDDTVAQVERELQASGLDTLAWQERMRRGLWAILCFLDREPVLARVAMVHVARGGGRVLECREAILQRLITAIDEGRRENEGESASRCSVLTAEGVLGAILAILHTRLARERREALAGLLGELTGLIVLPYRGPAAARREQTRPEPPAPERARPPRRAILGAPDPLAGLPMRLTYRTARVLEGVEKYPGASNRRVADHAGIGDQGQISKLLARLERLGLIANVSPGRAKGEPNSWTLTPTGVHVARALSTHPSTAPREFAA